MSKEENTGSKQVEKSTGADTLLKKTLSKGKTSQEMMRNHIRDEKDVISEEDFKNLKMDFEITADVAHKPLDIENGPDHPKDEDKDPELLLPWDLIK